MKYFISLIILCASLKAESPTENQKQDKVVLIHGIINHKSMSTFNRLLKKTNWEVEDFRYPSRDKTIQEHANSLVQHLNNTIEKEKPLNFIAFSLGGLILKTALNHPDCPKEAFQGKIVVISSPLNGSRTANQVAKLKLGRKILGRHAGKQLAETQKNGFDYLGEFPKDVPILIISGISGKSPIYSSKNDWIVSTHESCPNCAHEHTFVRSNHKFICRNIDTINKAIDFLRNEHKYSPCPFKKVQGI